MSLLLQFLCAVKLAEGLSEGVSNKTLDLEEKDDDRLESKFSLLSAFCKLDGLLLSFHSFKLCHEEEFDAIEGENDLLLKFGTYSSSFSIGILGGNGGGVSATSDDGVSELSVDKVCEGNTLSECLIVDNEESRGSLKGLRLFLL